MLGLEKKDLIELSKTDKVVSKYMEEVERVNESPEFREYISYEEEQRKIRNTLISEARKSGFEQGLEQKEREIVKNLLASGMKVEEIAEIIGLSEDEIKKIKDTD